MKKLDPVALVNKARATNTRRSKGERGFGWAAPEDGPPDLLLRTVMCAIGCGLQTSDWNAIAEGYEMLINLHIMLNGDRYDPVRLTEEENIP